MSQSAITSRPLESCLAQIHHAKSFRSAFMNEPHLSNTPLLIPLLDAVHLFNKLQIPYALIGGIAAMIYGRARFTDDVDFIAATGHESTLAANPSIMTAHHFDPASTWKLYHSSGLELDIWKDPFVDAITSRAQIITVSNTPIKVADVHDLIAMKLRAGRFQDDYDISEIIHHSPIDSAKLVPLTTPEELAKFHAILDRTRNSKK